MIVLILVLVVLVVAVGAGPLALGALPRDHGGRRWGAVGALAVPAVAVVLLALVALGVAGDRGEPDRTGAASETPSTAPLPLARIDRVAADLPFVRMQPVDADVFSPYRPVSGLAPGSVVRVVAEGYEWAERGRIEQCVTELGRQAACAASFPVQFDDGGKADFQFQVRGDVAPGGCRLGQATCFLRLTGDASRRVGTVQTVLVDTLNPGQVRVEPNRGLADGQTVDVSVTGFPAGSTAAAVLCAPPAAYDARRCTDAGRGATFTVDAAGAGRTTLVVSAGRLGADDVVCGPRRCGVAVVVGPGFVVAAPSPVGFSSGPGVTYDAGRLAAGIAVAFVLGVVAIGLAVRTDWTKPTEAASPALDGADLRAAWNLDELFGTEEELDERDPIPW